MCPLTQLGHLSSYSPAMEPDCVLCPTSPLPDIIIHNPDSSVVAVVVATVVRGNLVSPSLVATGRRPTPWASTRIGITAVYGGWRAGQKSWHTFAYPDCPALKLNGSAVPQSCLFLPIFSHSKLRKGQRRCGFRH